MLNSAEMCHYIIKTSICTFITSLCTVLTSTLDQVEMLKEGGKEK